MTEPGANPTDRRTGAGGPPPLLVAAIAAVCAACAFFSGLFWAHEHPLIPAARILPPGWACIRDEEVGALLCVRPPPARPRPAPLNPAEKEA